MKEYFTYVNGINYYILLAGYNVYLMEQDITKVQTINKIMLLSNDLNYIIWLKDYRNHLESMYAQDKWFSTIKRDDIKEAIKKLTL